MDKRLVVRNRIDKPLYSYLGKLSDSTLALLNRLYDEEESQDVMDISVSLRENVDIDAGNAMSDEFYAMISGNKYHQKLINKPSISNPTDEYDWYDYDIKYEPVIEELRNTVGVDKFYRLRMAWMEPGERVEPHVDQPHIDRFTMVMRGEHRFVLTVRGVEHEKIMKPGDIWYINTNWDHSVYTRNNEPRLALLGCFVYNVRKEDNK
jgi:mannose-6-phosphate isomerase-like protein (cupin superfamily)